MNERADEHVTDSESKRDRILIDAGLYDKIYMPETDEDHPFLDENSSYDYPESEYDKEKGKTVYYRKQPIKVSDEEFEAILQRTTSNHSNTLASIISLGAYVVFIIGFIAGVYIGAALAERDSNFNLLWAFIVWIIGAISGISLLWFAEVLKLLQGIKNQLNCK